MGKLWERASNLTVTNKLRLGKNATLIQQSDQHADANFSLSNMTAGTGTAGTGTIYRTSVQESAGIVTTNILIDLTGLNSSAAADIIGVQATANCHFGQITAAINGTILGGTMTCLEAPLTGEPDIDLYSADEATGTEDAAVTGLTETAILLAAADWTIGLVKGFATIAADQYLYLAGSGTGTDATYTAGIFLISIQGYRA